MEAERIIAEAMTTMTMMMEEDREGDGDVPFMTSALFMSSYRG